MMSEAMSSAFCLLSVAGGDGWIGETKPKAAMHKCHFFFSLNIQFNSFLFV